MVIEKVKEIKRAEEKADAIIKKSGEEAARIRGSLDSMIRSLKETKERNLAAETENHRKRREEETGKKIDVLEEDYEERKSFMRKESSGKILAASELVWDTIKKRFFDLPLTP